MTGRGGAVGAKKFQTPPFIRRKTKLMLGNVTERRLLTTAETNSAILKEGAASALYA